MIPLAASFTIKMLEISILTHTHKKISIKLGKLHKNKCKNIQSLMLHPYTPKVIANG